MLPLNQMNAYKTFRSIYNIYGPPPKNAVNIIIYMVSDAAMYGTAEGPPHTYMLPPNQLNIYTDVLL